MPRIRPPLSDLSLRDVLISAAPLVLLGAALLVLAYVLLDPTPPKKVVLATGSPQGAYAEFGKRYVEELKKYGVTVELRTTQGAAENLQLLRDRGQNVDLAFLQGGAREALYAIDEAEADAGLVSLGSLFYEPVWLFYRPEAVRRAAPAQRDGTLTQLSQLARLKLNIGAPGSGAANLVLKLLHANRLDSAQMKLSRLDPTPAVMALLAGEIDAMVLVSAPESPLVRMLLQTPGVRVVDFAQADAYARRFPFITALSLPRGVVDLAQDIPPQDVRLIAPTAGLVARDTLHPALTQLFVQAAARIHGGTGWFAFAGQFPNMQALEAPLAREAERYYRSGPPLLQRYLPFWLANLIDRMWVVLVSIIAALIPLSRVIPPLYEFRIRRRVFRWYRQLRAIEDALQDRSEPPAQLLEQLDALDARVERVHVPLSHTDELYALRSHIELVRARLRQALAHAPLPEAR
jgi:TRAP-type uncharacterized transport system substrate-binding protein